MKIKGRGKKKRLDDTLNTIGNLLPLPLPLPLLMKKTKIYDKKVLREKIRLSTVRGNL